MSSENEGVNQKLIQLTIAKDCDGVKELLEKGNLTHANFQDEQKQRTALHYACAAGLHEIVQAILNTPFKLPINLNLQDFKGRTPLLAACRALSDPCIEALLSACAEDASTHLSEPLDLNIQSNAKWTPWIYACAASDLETVQALIEVCCTPSAKVSALDINATEQDGYSGFMFACAKSNESIVDATLKACKNEAFNLKAPLDLNLESSGLTAPLIALVTGEGEEIVTNILNSCTTDVKNIAPLNLNHTDSEGRSLFVFAEMYPGTEMIQGLLDACGAGSDLNLAEPLDINAQGVKQRSGLMRACKKGNIDNVNIILSACVEGAKIAPLDLNLLDHEEKTAFMLACHHKHPDVIDALLGAVSPDSKLNLAAPLDLNLACDTGPPIVYCALEGLDDLLEAILDACSTDNDKIASLDLNALDEDDWTALMFAAAMGNSDVVNLILGATAADSKVNIAQPLDINIVDKENGNSALLLACMKGYDTIVDAILKVCQSDAKITPLDLDLRNENEQTASQLAEDHDDILASIEAFKGQ